MDDTKTIKLPCHNIVVTLTNDEPDDMSQYWQSGTITSDMKEICKYCKDSDCLMDCPDFGEHCTDRDLDEFNRKNDEGIEFRRHRGMIDVLESLTLHHAVAGIDIESPAYIEGIETVLDAIGNNT